MRVRNSKQGLRYAIAEVRARACCNRIDRLHGRDKSGGVRHGEPHALSLNIYHKAYLSWRRCLAPHEVKALHAILALWRQRRAHHERRVQEAAPLQVSSVPARLQKAAARAAAAVLVVLLRHLPRDG